MPRRYTFLFAPIEAVGHFNACIGISQHLLKRGHRVVFATPNSFRGKLIAYGFDEEYFQDIAEDESNEKWGEIVSAMAPALALPPMQKMEFLNFALYQEVVKKAYDSDANLRKIMDNVKPDVVIVDNVVQLPALMDASVPWVMSTSLNPLGIDVTDTLPPAFSGLPIINSDKSAWREYGEKEREVFQNLFTEFNNWVTQNGGPVLEYKTSPYWQKFSPFANICMSPNELAYSMYSPIPKNWQRFEAFMRTEEGMFEIPSQLQSERGKLIYFSMGSIGASELGLMRKLIGFLAKSPNRFIVSKGPLGDQLILPNNMWGENILPQTLVIPFVDLVITHGGNNTVTETFAIGKPLLVLPLFCDQLDNASRVEETGHGLCFEPYHVTEDELLGAIESLLRNELLKRRMISISTRIKASNCQSRAADVIESVARNNMVLRKDMEPSTAQTKYSKATCNISFQRCYVNRTNLNGKPYDLLNYHWENGDITRQIVWKDKKDLTFSNDIKNFTSSPSLNDTLSIFGIIKPISSSFNPESDLGKGLRKGFDEVSNVANDLEKLPSTWQLLAVAAMAFLCLLLGMFLVFKLKKRRKAGLINLNQIFNSPPPVNRSDSDCGSDRELLPLGLVALP